MAYKDDHSGRHRFIEKVEQNVAPKLRYQISEFPTSLSSDIQSSVASDHEENRHKPDA